VETDPEHIRRALALWEDFPVYRSPRPIVVTAPSDHPHRGGSAELRRLGDWEAFPASELTPDQRKTAHRHCRARRSDPDHPLGRILRGDVVCGTDRGEQYLPGLAVQCGAHGEGFIGLDAEFERTMTWRPPGMANSPSGTHATIATDDRTLTVTFRTFRSGVSSHPDAEAVETRTAVLVPAIEDWLLQGPYLGIPGHGGTVVHLAAPLGNRVLIRLGRHTGADSCGTPIPVHRVPTPT
jgi:hypothetical protein